MKLKQNKTQVYLLLIFSLALLIGVGYAALSATLNINGQITINKASWNIHMEDISVTSGSVTATTTPTLDDAKTTVSFSVTLTNPGDFYEFTVKEVNKGTIDAMVSTISKTGLTVTQAKYLDYTVTYDSGLELAQNQILKSGNSEYLRVKVAFKKDVTASDLPTADSTLNLNFSLSYQQAESNAVTLAHPTCKRATVLHTEICNKQYGCLAHKTGDVITYGNLGTTGTLTSGDAFDCDVNGDGVYDPNAERFYYVSGKDGDDASDYVALLYYDSLTDGDTYTFAYNSEAATSTDYYGPVTAIKQLPTTKQWKNVKLSNTTRNIIDEKGTVRVNNFSYSGYAARLLTAQEVNRGCGIAVGNQGYGQLKKCMYLVEQTNYSGNSNNSSGIWLETPSSTGIYVYGIFSNSLDSYSYPITTSDTFSIRPVIEVEKANISY